MRIVEMTDAEVRALFDASVESGVTMFDHAAAYGGKLHGCETRFAEALKLTPAQRSEIVLQTKVGLHDGEFDFSHDHIIESVDGSLAALQTDFIDVLLLHRPDGLVEPEEVAAAFDELASAGKVRHFGVSNHTPGQIELLKRYVKQPLVANQLQFSLGHANIVAAGMAANMNDLDQSIDRDNGILDYSRVHDITVQAWSPAQAGFFGGTFIGDRDRYAELNTALDELAAKYAVTPTGIAMAWITRHPARMQVVLGTTRPERIRESAAGSELPLTRAEWYRLFTAAGYSVP
ncbi:MAG: aldo/keto reductase, partial [Rhodoglobus sp.]